MDKGDKNSQTHGQNLFETTASLIGTSPFSSIPVSSSLPFPHLAHLPSAFSMLGQHPAFPLSIGGFDFSNPLASPILSPSLTSTAGSLHQPLFGVDPMPLQLASSKFLSTSLSALTTNLTNTKASTSSATSLTSTTNVVGSANKHSSLASLRAISLFKSKQRNKIPKVEVSRKAELDLPLPPSKYEGKKIGASSCDSDSQSDVSSGSSSLSSDDSSDRNVGEGEKLKDDKSKKIETKNSKDINESGADRQKKNCQVPAIQIDGLQKKLIADQIRQRMQRTQQNTVISGGKRLRGRPKKHQRPLTEEEIVEHKNKQHKLKQQLEAELKQQQLQLKLMKKVQAQKEREKSQPMKLPAPNKHLKPCKPGEILDNKIRQLTEAKQGVDQEKKNVPVKETRNKQSDLESASEAAMKEHLVARFKSVNTSKSEASSAVDSDSDTSSGGSDSGSDASDSDEDEKATGTNVSENPDRSHSKRGAERSSDDLPPSKRPRVQMDERELRIPLEHGWRRQTNILTMGKRGIIGDVWYFAPCGKKMKTIPDVMRYLHRNKITDLGRNSFTFSTKVNIGDFLEARQGGFVPLSEPEILERLAVAEQKKLRRQQILAKQAEKHEVQQQLVSQMMEAKVKQMAKRADEVKLHRRLEKQKLREMAKRAKHLNIVEKQKEKDHQRIMKEQEKIKKQEQLRMERDMRAQQLLEYNLLWYHMEREREMKRQQAQMVKEQDKERKRQHIVLLKALEARKKQEEKDRIRGEKLAEKTMHRVKKMEQRRMELQLASELKKPTEDMELRDTKALPDLPRISGVKLAGSAFADCLMVLEFLHNFSDALGFDEDSLPTLKMLQDGLLNETEDDVEDMLSLVTHLLRYALEDPGVPNPKEAVTKLGQKITDIEITDTVLAEILRVFILVRNGRKNQMCDWLSEKPFESLNPSQKSAILSFICNELLCSKSIIGEIDKHLEHMSTIRRDKWIVEGKLRRSRIILARKFNRPISKPISDPDINTSAIGDGEDSSLLNASVTSKNGSEDEDEKDESGNESEENNDGNDTGAPVQMSEEEEEPSTLEEVDKQIEKLQKQHAQYRAEVFEASHKLRAISFGEDRCRRRYWTLPCAGGVYVESLESGKFCEIADVSCKMDKVSLDTAKINNESHGFKDTNIEIKHEKTSEMNGEKAVVENDVASSTITSSDKSETPDSADRHSSNSGVAATIKTEKHEKPDNTSCNEEIVKPKLKPSNVPKCEAKSEPSSASICKVNSEPSSVPKCEAKSEPSSASICKVNSEPSSVPKCEAKSNASTHEAHSVTNFLFPTGSSTKLSGLCNIASKTESQADSKAVVNNFHPAIVTSSSPLSSALFFPPPFPVCSFPNNGLLSSEPSTSLASSSASSSSPKLPPAHTSSSDTKPSFMSIDSILKKENGPTVQNNHFLPSGMFPVIPLPPGQLLTNFTDLTEQKPWFSILPRMPCDEVSLTLTQQPSFSPSVFGASSFFSPFHNFPIQCPNFPSFQMGQLCGTPSDFTISSLLNNSSEQNDSFKVPSTPRSETETPSVCQSETSTAYLMKTVQGEALPIASDLKCGWWRVTDADQLREIIRSLHPRGIRERALMKVFQKYQDYACNSCSKGNKDVVSVESSSESSDEEEEDKDKKEEMKTEGKQNVDEKPNNDEPPEKTNAMSNRKPPEPDKDSDWLSEVGHEIELAVIDEVENLESRVSSASLQVKSWKLSQKDKELKVIPRSQTVSPDIEIHPLDLARNRLRNVESHIERRYLKPPLTKNIPLNLASMTLNNSLNDSRGQDLDDIDDVEDVPPGLATWRRAVQSATSAAQLTLCLYQLNNAIAWEKSIMKVLCQICRKDDNEAELLLCDGCDRGYHTYCFKPKMETVPDGDWYCFECISKALGEACCIVCGKKTGKLAECSLCPRATHIDCLDPPLPRLPRRWSCAACVSEKPKKRGRRGSEGRKNSQSSAQSPKPRERKNSETPKPETPEKIEKKPKAKDIEKKKIAEQSCDMTLCRLILTDMDKHEHGWPFVNPVNFKQFPAYKKYIKQPMDFSNMKTKLRDNLYKSRLDFATDARLIFNNCQVFNEDDSEVGRSGHTMREFFEKRWKELLLSSDENSS